MSVRHIADVSYRNYSLVVRTVAIAIYTTMFVRPRAQEICVTTLMIRYVFGTRLTSGVRPRAQEIRVTTLTIRYAFGTRLTSGALAIQVVI